MPTPPTYTDAFQRIGSGDLLSTWGLFRTAVISVTGAYYDSFVEPDGPVNPASYVTFPYLHSAEYITPGTYPYAMGSVDETTLFKSYLPNTAQGSIATGTFYSSTLPAFTIAGAYNPGVGIDEDQWNNALVGGTVAGIGGPLVMTADAMYSSTTLGQSTGTLTTITSITPLP